MIFIITTSRNKQKLKINIFFSQIFLYSKNRVSCLSKRWILFPLQIFQERFFTMSVCLSVRLSVRLSRLSNLSVLPFVSTSSFESRPVRSAVSVPLEPVERESSGSSSTSARPGSTSAFPDGWQTSRRTTSAWLPRLGWLFGSARDLGESDFQYFRPDRGSDRRWRVRPRGRFVWPELGTLSGSASSRVSDVPGLPPRRDLNRILKKPRKFG